MPAFLGWDIGPQQIDQPIARDRARSSLEMQVQQDGQMFLGAEADGRAAAANELGGSENLQLKLSNHCTPSHAPKRSEERRVGKEWRDRSGTNEKRRHGDRAYAK